MILIVLICAAIVDCFRRIWLFPKGSLERKLTILGFIAVWSMGLLYVIDSREIHWRIIRIVGWVSLFSIMWLLYNIPEPGRHEKRDIDAKSDQS